MADIAGAEDRRGKCHEGRQRDEINVEVVNDKDVAAIAIDQQQRRSSHEGQTARQHVEHRADPVAGNQHQHHDGNRRNQENGIKRVDHSRPPCSPRNRSSALTSTVSKRSRIRNTKIPKTIKAIRIENAVENSTTSGIPLAPEAASTRPFSSDMKPTICVTALRRVIIISKPSRMTASAKARSSRTRMLTFSPIGSMSRIDSATRPSPTSMVSPAPMTSSISR